jgi:hypothetical protein
MLSFVLILKYQIKIIKLNLEFAFIERVAELFNHLRRFLVGECVKKLIQAFDCIWF